MHWRLARNLVFGLVFYWQGAIAQTDTTLWRFVNPKAKAVIGINWSRIQQTRAGTLLREKLGDSPLPLPLLGINLFSDIERVVISSSGNPDPEDQSEAPI